MNLPTWSFWGVLTSAIIAQACCGLPVLALSLGFGSTTLAFLEVLKPWRPLFVVAALGFLGAGLFQFWRQRQAGFACPLKPPGSK